MVGSVGLMGLMGVVGEDAGEKVGERWCFIDVCVGGGLLIASYDRLRFFVVVLVLSIESS